MTALWFVTVAGWVIALAAFVAARRAARAVAELTAQYWALKYEVGELKARLRAVAPTPDEAAAAAPAPTSAFVPLSAIKKGSGL
ncbi:MAG: hypothetical protein AB1635_17385 [Acidobacteriota bacterium]